MKRPIAIIVLAGLASVLARPLVASAESPAPGGVERRRFALVVGANNGGGDRVVLRYAHSDAQSVARVIRDLGGVSPGDVKLLLDPNRTRLDATFASLGRELARARSDKRRIELLVYYSGHSDEEGLLLGGARYSYPELRAQLARMPADVKIAILDSCSSGAFTRTKGGVMRPAFVVDESSQVSGHAFLSSSSANEAAQESDRIGASFFTHFLVSGLRGGADANGDGRVTLSEAYHFAFNETVARTEATQSGAQHPAYDMHLVGTGDVIMTDLHDTSASLALDKDIAGRLFIRDASGRLVIEMRKSAGTAVVLGLSRERYQVLLQRDDARWFRADVDLASARKVTLGARQFQAFRTESTVARGNSGASVNASARAGASLAVGAAPGGAGQQDVDAASPAAPVDDPADAQPVTYAPFSVSVVPGLSTSRGQRTVNRFSLNLLIGSGYELDGLELGGLMNIRSGRTRGAQIAGIGNINDGHVHGVQIAGVGNINGGYVRGGQIAGIGNWNDGDLRGPQLAGIGNWNNGHVRGFQAAGIGNINGGYARGIQIAGIGNINDGYVRGAQIAGVGNWNDGSVRGLQIAGVGNVADGDVEVAQIAGVTNVARGDIAGAQIGLVNIGGQVRGLQLGLVNIARRVDGVQLGLVNVSAHNDGIPIGLATVVKDGRRALEVWTSDLAPVSMAFKYGSKSFYSMAAIRSDNDVLMAGLGIGVHTQRPRYYFDIDMAAYGMLDYQLDETSNDLLTEARVMVGFPLLDDLSVFGGAAITGLLAFDGKPGAQLTPLESKVYRRDDVVLRLSPGLFAGISY